MNDLDLLSLFFKCLAFFFYLSLFFKIKTILSLNFSYKGIRPLLKKLKEVKINFSEESLSPSTVVSLLRSITWNTFSFPHPFPSGKLPAHIGSVSSLSLSIISVRHSSLTWSPVSLWFRGAHCGLTDLNPPF